MKALTSHVLKSLADGEFHSGEALGRSLGMSRASVWNAMRELGATGLEIYSVRGRGYRLPQPLSLLDSSEVEGHLQHHGGRFTLEIVDSVGSTNTLLMQRAQAGAPGATVIAAEWQSGGRGRHGRAWHAGIGGALTFSLLWRFTQGASSLAGLSLAIGVALARACAKLGIAGASLKWPNDVVWRGKKLAGILIEMQGDALGPSLAVIGIGVNVRLSAPIRARIDQDVTDLESASGRTLDRNELLALLLEELWSVLETFARDGFASLRGEWQQRHAYQGRAVSVVLSDTRRESGVARGVAEDGALLVETHAGMRRYHTGEISLRSSPSRRSRSAEPKERA
jgi:BirA family biotin operon repressor/biotin-[acetyl-CoA-carboxylase] ligase